MRRLGLALLTLLALVASAAAQGCGESNPNCIVTTAPLGTNNNQAASTAFVQSALTAPITTSGLTINGAPNYNLASNVLAVPLFMPLNATTQTVPAGKEFNYIRSGNNDGTDVVWTLGNGSTVTGPNFSLSLDATSNANSNGYGGVFHIHNLGAGNGRGLHVGAYGCLTPQCTNLSVGGSGTISGAGIDLQPTTGLSGAWGIFTSLNSSGVNGIGIGYGIETLGDTYSIGFGSTIAPVGYVNAAYRAWIDETKSGANARLFQGLNHLGTEIASINKDGSFVSAVSVTSPIIAGGSAASSPLVLESTSGAGTTDSIQFKTGSQVVRGSIATGGQWAIGPTAPNAVNNFWINAHANSASTDASAGRDLLISGADGASAAFDIDAYGGVASIIFRRINGTAASRSGVLSGDSVGSISAQGYTSAPGFTASNAAVLRMDATENWSGTANGAKFLWRTTKNTTTTLADAMQLDGVGHLQIGSIAPASLSTCGTGTIAANSTDSSGAATATGATACTVNFGNSYATAPNCTVSDKTTAAALKVAETTGGFTVTGLTSGDTFGWHCFAKVGL